MIERHSQLIWWLCGAVAFCACLAVCLLLCARRKPRRGSERNAEAPVPKPGLTVLFPVDEFKEVASRFEGSYEPLYQVVHGGRTDVDRVVGNWRKKVQLLEGNRLLKAYFANGADQSDDQWSTTSFAERLLADVFDSGVRRDGRSQVILEQDLPDGYFMADEKPHCVGDVATVKKPVWSLSGKVIETGVLDLA